MPSFILKLVLPDLSDFTRDELIRYLQHYHKSWVFHKRGMTIYKEILGKIISPLDTDGLCQENRKESSFKVNEEKLHELIEKNSPKTSSQKIESPCKTPLNTQLNKNEFLSPRTEIINENNLADHIKAMLTIQNLRKQLSELQDANIFLEKELLKQREESNSIIEELKRKLQVAENDNPIYQQKQTIHTMMANRKNIPIYPVMGKNPDGIIASKLFGSEYLYGKIDTRVQLFSEQVDNEMKIIEQFMTNIKNVFETLPTGVSKLTENTVCLDVNTVLMELQKSRHRLSFMMKEKDFADFLGEHVLELREILELLGSKTIHGTKLNMFLTHYERGILWMKENNDNYLYGHESLLEIQKRLLTSVRLDNKLKPFKKTIEFSSVHLFSQLEDTANAVLITSTPFNNIIYIPLKTSFAPDYYSFYYLERFESENEDNFICSRTRVWKLDSHLLYVTRIFAQKYQEFAVEAFRRFYYDVFGHNNYIKGFESLFEEKGIVRWKQFKILFENIQICSDEYLLGEILRKVIYRRVQSYPQDKIDIFQGDKDSPAVALDFKNMRQRWNKKLPAYEEEPEEYLYNCFDTCILDREDRDNFNKRYQERWACFLNRKD